MNFLRTLDAHNLRGKRVILRADYNVPIIDGEVRGDYRIKKSLPTIEFLRDAGAKVVIISHLGGENGKTLGPVATYLSKYIDIVFAPDMKSMETRHVVNSLGEGETILLENVRNDPGEKKNSQEFAKFLATFGDIYVNDAFSASHREHASIVSLPRLLPHYAGLLFEEELLYMKEALEPKHPFLLIVGGAKFDTKLPLIKKFGETADSIFIGGALAHNLFKEKGYDIGVSLIDDTVRVHDLINNKKIWLPSEVIVQNGEEILTKDIQEVGGEDKIVDAGEQTLESLRNKIREAQFILWNGPLGSYEEGFSEGSRKLAHMIAESSARVLVGGGDTLTALEAEDSKNERHHISTAGGAMLQYLIDETLPGISALET